MNKLPKYIALCGWPKSGKDEVARLFAELLGARVIDDGGPLRLAAPHLFNYDPNFPFSQDGKATNVKVPNGETTVRFTLGDLGSYLEKVYGEQFLAWRALQETTKYDDEHFVFPSVRKTQGQTYLEAGGVLIEVRRPGFDSSPHDFDWYDPSLVTHIIHNNGTLDELRGAVLDMIKLVSQE